MYLANKIYLLLLLATALSCQKSQTNSSENTEKEKIKTSRWLLGTWENKGSDGTLKEIWNKVNDSTFAGQSYFIKAQDTIHFETIQLQQIDENLTYTSTTKGQNNNQPIAYKATNSSEKELVFENTSLNYPQKIRYTAIATDSLKIEISGMQQSKPSTERYGYKKVK
ncbi:DUF6265 family protein [Flavobacterium crassostreae]|uniref:DUF6265 domain-containing protein n=1 Tax=Flavobacterium crassostreae TaxID=1763534 RepID=A0A1B9E903_9FLAO|nr:DUF6265 family protein [Flavobacterium crassostreae]OCB78391.1 hypothetical protein LPBF_02365 [Flavobacterium crassostreae]